MPIEITIPRLGWSMDEGNFTGWLRKEGELVKAGEALFTLESEKASQDIEAADSGVLQLQPDSPNPGDIVKVGQVIALLLSESDNANSATVSVSPATTAATPPITKTEVDSKTGSEHFPSVPSPPAAAKATPAISPRARRRAAELGVDATRLQGSGRTGRIVEADVVKAAQRIPTLTTSTMRKLIAQRTATSFATIPHFYLRSEVDATALLRLREDLLPEIESTTGVRLTLSDLLLRAQALALRDFPAANAIWVDGNLLRLSGCDVGLVVGLPEGLLIPVMRCAHEGDLASVTTQRSALVAAAKAGQLTQEQMQGGATSLSNLGNSRVDEFVAVISPGQSTMLAVGRAAPRPFALNGKLAVRTTLKLCLSVDHRVMDGGPASEFLGRIVELLEAPKALVDEGASR